MYKIGDVLTTFTFKCLIVLLRWLGFLLGWLRQIFSRPDGSILILNSVRFGSKSTIWPHLASIYRRFRAIHL